MISSERTEELTLERLPESIEPEERENVLRRIEAVGNLAKSIRSNLYGKIARMTLAEPAEKAKLNRYVMDTLTTINTYARYLWQEMFYNRQAWPSAQKLSYMHGKACGLRGMFAPHDPRINDLVEMIEKVNR